jgi:hypothetical protein
VGINGQALHRLLDDDPRMGYKVMTAVARLLARRLEATRRSIMAAQAMDVDRQPLPF